MGVSLVDFVRFALALIRFATFLVVIPVLNMRNAPILVKIGLAALCALAVMPELDAAYNPEHLGVLAVLALQEVAVGLLLAFVLILVFSAVTIAGHFIDTPIGFGMASVFDPALGGQVPVFSQFNRVLASLVFLVWMPTYGYCRHCIVPSGLSPWAVPSVSSRPRPLLQN